MTEQDLWDIAQIVDDWYLEWKGQFPNVPHPLGLAKEDLKSRLCEWIEKRNERQLVEDNIKRRKTTRR